MNVFIAGILTGVVAIIYSYLIAFMAAKGWYAGRPQRNIGVNRVVHQSEEER